MAFLAAEAFDLSNSCALDTDFRKRLTDIIEFEGFDNCGDQFLRFVSVGVGRRSRPFWYLEFEVQRVAHYKFYRVVVSRSHAGVILNSITIVIVA